MRWFREDVHVHAPPADVHRRLSDLDTAEAWMGPSFASVEGRDEQLYLGLALPGRRESIRLRVHRREPPVLLELGAPDGELPTFECTYLVNAEGPSESHVIAEVRYSGAGGLFGPLLDILLHRPHRRQAFRDALWRLKLLIEGAR